MDATNGRAAEKPYESGSDRSGAQRRATETVPTPERWHVTLTGVYQRYDYTGPSYADASWTMELNPGATRYELLKQCKKQVAEGVGIAPERLAVLFFSCEPDRLN